MAETAPARPRRAPFTYGSFAGGGVSVVACGWLAIIIATGHTAPGRTELAAVLAILGGVALAALQVAWLVVDQRTDIRAVHALLADFRHTSAPAATAPEPDAQSVEWVRQEQRQSPQRPERSRPHNRGGRKRGRGGRGGEAAKESDSGQGDAGTEWLPTDERYMEDIAEAVRLGRTLPGPAEPA